MRRPFVACFSSHAKAEELEKKDQRRQNFSRVNDILSSFISEPEQRSEVVAAGDEVGVAFGERALEGGEGA